MPTNVNVTTTKAMQNKTNELKCFFSKAEIIMYKTKAQIIIFSRAANNTIIEFPSKICGLVRVFQNPKGIKLNHESKFVCINF